MAAKYGIDQLMKLAVNAKTAEEKEGYLKRIDELKMNLVNRLDSIGSQPVNVGDR